MVEQREVVKVAQALLARSRPGLVADGWWGNYTNEAFLRAPKATQETVREVLQLNGITPEGALQKTRLVRVQETTLGEEWISEDYAFSLIDRHALKHQVSADIMRKFLRVEAIQTVRDGVRYYNARSVSPSGWFKGLYQMGERAWKDVQASVGVGYDQVFDPNYNTLAAVLYVKQNMRTARAGFKGKLGKERVEFPPFKGEFTSEVLYAMHNQGAVGFLRLLATGRRDENVTRQSAVAQQMIAAALSQNGVRLA